MKRINNLRCAASAVRVTSNLALRTVFPALVTLCFIFKSIASAQSPTIQLNGLSLPCKDCGVRRDGTCEISNGSEPELLNCDAALEQLLHQVEDSYDGRHPSADELRDFLVRQSPSEQAAKSALSLLCSNADGQHTISVNAHLLVPKFEEQFTALARAKKCSSGMWLEVWKLPSTNGIQLSPALQATIAARESSLTLDDLIQDLSIVDPNSELPKLEMYATTLHALESNWAADIDTLIARLRSCLEQFGKDEASVECRAPALRKLSPSIAKYIQRVQVSRVLYLLKTEKFAPERTVEALSQTNYAESRTQEAHAEMLRALLEGARVPDREVRKKILSEDYRIMLQSYADADAEIGKALATLILRYAKEIAEDGKIDQAILLTQRSLLVYHDELEARDQLIETLGTHPLVQNNSDLQDKLSALRRREFLPKRVRAVYHPESWEQIVEELAFIFVIALAMSIAKSIYKWRRDKSRQVLSTDERRELRDLFAYFGVSPFAPVKDLTKQYYERAKLVHPDAGGSVDEFNLLTERYERAMELLSRGAH